MRLKTHFCGALLAILAIIAASLPVQALAATPAITPMTTAWLGENEAFAVWYAKQKGWDKEAGLDVTMLRFDSGKALVEGVKAYNWAVAGCGAVPALTATLSERLSIIAVANDESTANAIYVRADSPILKVRGANPAYPNIYGDRAMLAQKQILCPKGTSAHFLLDTWLSRLGLTEKDVRIKYLEPTPALGAFSAGIGDAVALWAPLTYEAESKGFKPAALSADCGVSQPVLLVANKNFAEQNPQQIEAFLTMYFRAIDMVRSTPLGTLAQDYMRFSKEWCGRTLTAEQAERDIKEHPVFTLEQQLALFDTAKGKSQLQNWLGGIVDFYGKSGSVSQMDRQRLQRLNAVTDVYLKALRQKRA